MREIDELKLYRGDNYILPNGVEIKCPTLGEICDYGESEYLSMISIFTATNIDRCAQLEDMGIDYTEITNFQMFTMFAMMLSNHRDKENGKIDSSPLFGKLDFSSFIPVECEGKLCMVNPDNIKSGIRGTACSAVMTIAFSRIEKSPKMSYKYSQLS